MASLFTIAAFAIAGFTSQACDVGSGQRYCEPAAGVVLVSQAPKPNAEHVTMPPSVFSPAHERVRTDSSTLDTARPAPEQPSSDRQKASI